MPRYPNVAESIATAARDVYSAFARKAYSRGGKVYPLHIGDTYLEPAVGCRMQDITVQQHPGMHRYAPVRGVGELLEAVAHRVARRSGVPTRVDDILVTAGATGGLGAVVGALLEPGDEVLILAPHWPLIAGIVRSFHGTATAVPFIDRVDSPEAAVAAVDAYRSERTVALYLNTPNNPTGRVLPRPWLEALARWAQTQSLWLLADDVYEDYVYAGEHTYMRALAPERTFAVHSFSKAYGMAGNRVGYVAAPAGCVEHVRKVSTHTYYSTPTASQLAALNALGGPGDQWVEEVKPAYAHAGKQAAERLGTAPPEGSTFLFVDVTAALDARGLEGLLADCADAGLLVAPGPVFGPYPNHVRLCFTSAPPEDVAAGVEVLARRLGR